jgi:YhcH/YjgK/YiaL family protein
MGWCPLSPDLEEEAPYDAERDVTFYKALVPDSSIVLSPGCFAVLYPEDVHRPQASVVEDAPGKVTKVVVKVAIDSL